MHVRDVLGETQAYQDEVAVAMAAGWTQSIAEQRAGFILLGQQAGLTYDESFALYEDYTRALHDGDLERQAEIEALLGDELTAFQATKDAEVAAAKKAADDEIRERERVTDAALGAFERSQAEGARAYDAHLEKAEDVYDTVKQEALDAGKTEEEASKQAAIAKGKFILQAEDVRKKAIKEALEAEKDKFIRLAAMEAAMSLGTEATQEERAEAARNASIAAGESWTVALCVVGESDAAATDAMGENAEARTTKASEESENIRSNIEQDMVTGGVGGPSIVQSAEQAEQDMAEAFDRAKYEIVASAEGMRDGVNTRLDGIEDKEVEIRYTELENPPIKSDVLAARINTNLSAIKDRKVKIEYAERRSSRRRSNGMSRRWLVVQSYALSGRRN